MQLEEETVFNILRVMKNGGPSLLPALHLNRRHLSGARAACRPPSQPPAGRCIDLAMGPFASGPRRDSLRKCPGSQSMIYGSAGYIGVLPNRRIYVQYSLVCNLTPPRERPWYAPGAFPHHMRARDASGDLPPEASIEIETAACAPSRPKSRRSMYAEERRRPAFSRRPEKPPA